MAADLNFVVFVFISRGKGGKKTAKVFTLNAALKGPSLLFQQRNYLCNNTELSCRIYALVAEHEYLCFYRSSCCRLLLWGQISG